MREPRPPREPTGALPALPAEGEERLGLPAVVRFGTMIFDTGLRLGELVLGLMVAPPAAAVAVVDVFAAGFADAVAVRRATAAAGTGGAAVRVVALGFAAGLAAPVLPIVRRI